MAKGRSGLSALSSGGAKLSGGGKGDYTSFSDTASGGWTYAGSGREQVKFFADHTNADALIGGMDAEERRAFRDWTRGHFMGGQQYHGWDSMSSDDKRYTQIYDDILDKATLDKGVVVTRRSDAQLVMGAGVRFASLDALKAAKGSIITAKASMSTGAAAQGLTIGDSSKNVEYRISIPAGSTGAGMWVGDNRINGWGAEQREFMTNRDTTYQVGNVTYDSRRDIYTVELQYIGREKHDYGKSGRIRR